MKMNNKQMIEIYNLIEWDKNARIYTCEQSFERFFIWYFTTAQSCKLSYNHRRYIHTLMRGDWVIFNGPREWGKTTLIEAYIIRCIVYKKKWLIEFFCDEAGKASDKVMNIIVHLQDNSRLIADFWQMYNEKRDVNKATKKRVGDFIASNGVQVQAMGIGESLRWVKYTVPWVGEFRPDLVVLDDIDTNTTTQNQQQIDKREHLIRNEIIWAMPDYAQFVFLFNTIREDWCWPRFFKFFWENKRVKCFRFPAILDTGEIDRKERYTMDMMDQKRMNMWDIEFNQNYLLIPYLWWQSVIKREWIREYSTPPEKYDYLCIWVDPSISDKTSSDWFGICLSWLSGDTWYIIKSLALYWWDKENAYTTIEQRYKDYNVNIVNVETVAFQEVVRKQISANNIATQAINTHKDKTTRLMERETPFKLWKVIFLPWNQDLINELITFPNWKYDDRVDAMMFSMKKRTQFFVV